MIVYLIRGKSVPFFHLTQKIMQDRSFIKEISICLDVEGQKKGGKEGSKGALGNLGNDGYISYLDRGDDFTGVHICQNLPNFTL